MMKIKIKYLIQFIFISSIFISLFILIYFLRGSKHNHSRMERKFTNESIIERKEIYNKLSKFERVTINELPITLVIAGNLGKEPYRKMISKRYFFKLSKKQTRKKIVGNFRIIDFISRDWRNNKYIFFQDNYYWLVDPEVLVAFLRLKHEMEKSGLNWNKITLTSAHRTPTQNKKVGGASRSRHICGEAIDFKVGDVDGNSIVNAYDKLKVLRLCEKIIGDKGGIGLYPGTPTIHIDTRGKRARWNSY